MKNYLFLVITTVFLASCNGQTKQEKSQPTKVAVNDLPQMEITFLDGTKKQARELTGKTLLVMFFPDCEHCQDEARAMASRLEAFETYNIYYLSSTPKAEVEAFAKNYELIDKKNVKFGMVPGESVINNFGPIPTPSVYIYNEEKRLIKRFEGQTDIEIIISAL